MISDAAVMTNPVSRAGPFVAPAQAGRRSAAARGRSCPCSAATGSPWRRAAARCRSADACRCSAASRLCAEVMAWKSPLKCRLILSTGCSDALPPPVAPPFCPNTGPSDGSRSAATACLPTLDQPLRQADRGHRLAFAARRRRDGGDEDQLAAARGKPVEQLEADLRGVAAVGFEQVVGEAEALGNGGDGLHDPANDTPAAPGHASLPDPQLGRGCADGQPRLARV